MKILVGNGLTEKKALEIGEGASVETLMKQRGLNGQTVVAVLNGQVAHPSTRLREGDELELVGVIYGG